MSMRSRIAQRVPGMRAKGSGGRVPEMIAHVDITHPLARAVQAEAVPDGPQPGDVPPLAQSNARTYAACELIDDRIG